MRSDSTSPRRERSTSTERKSQEFATSHRHHAARRHYSLSRNYRNAIIAVALLYLIHTLGRLTSHIYNAKLRDKPTDFKSLAASAEPIWSPKHPIRTGNGTHIDDRYIFMRKLGQGAEGKVAIYVDTKTDELVVVKTYNYGHRGNPLPDDLRPVFGAYTTQWRNEIEASILLGEWKEHEFSDSFVPVRDYFILQSSAGSGWTWALVTPFIEGGTLVNLAKKTRKHAQTAMELDQTYRPVLHSLLNVMGQMHTDGYCHDDIKPDNIFISASDPQHWLIGDLGQVRQEAHPMHTSWGWKDRNQWSDCRLNDVRRLLKTYITFLRDASASEEGFDRAFVDRRDTWAKLYWAWMKQPVDAGATVALSQLYTAELENALSLLPAKSGKEACVSRKVDQELLCTRLHTQWRDYLFAFQC